MNAGRWLLLGLVLCGFDWNVPDVVAAHVERERKLAREDLLRGLCMRAHDAQKDKPDPTASEEEQGLIDAWRIFKRRQPTADTKDGRRAPGTTLRIIEENLDRLCELGCFVRNQRSDTANYQATWRYQVLCRELAASAAFVRVRRAQKNAQEGDA